LGGKTFHLFWVKAPLSQGRAALLCSETAWLISHENECFDDFFCIFGNILIFLRENNEASFLIF
jgi:hypothetical protein